MLVLISLRVLPSHHAKPLLLLKCSPHLHVSVGAAGVCHDGAREINGQDVNFVRYDIRNSLHVYFYG